MNFRILLSVCALLCAFSLRAQVGVNTTTPNAQLEIKSSNEAAPANIDGLIIPKVNVFPATNPTAAQQGMMVYLTTASGTDLPGFYYWDNTTIDWKPIMGANVGTLDQAYDFGGAGNGKTITADAGAVTINGTDGLVVNGTYNSGTLAPTGAGTKMFWNPRKAAFRAGRVTANEWDDVNLGFESVAFGNQTTASGSYSSAFGWSSEASGSDATAFGLGTKSANAHTFAAGFITQANGYLSTAFGDSGIASSYGETVFGIGATTYTPSTNGVNQFRAANSTDRLFVIGNAIDTNANFFVDTAERSDAMIVLKNGLTRLPSTTNAMISAADGKAVVTKEYVQSNSWSLTGNSGTNPATNYIGTADNQDLVFKRNNSVSGRISSLNTSFGLLSLVSPNPGATQNTAFGNSSLSVITDGIQNASFGYNSLDANTIGFGNSAFGCFSLTQNSTGGRNSGFGRASLITNTTGIHNSAFGFQADVLSGNLDNATAIGAYAAVGASNSMVLGSINGVNFATASTNVGIGTTTPASRLHVVGNIRMVDGNQAAGKVLTSDVNGTATWQNASNNAWGLLGNTGTNATTNFLGTIDNVDLVFRRNNISSGKIGLNNTFFGVNSGVVNTGDYNTFIGERAGFANATGQDNTFLGRLAGANGTFGDDNSYIGYAAGLNSTGNSNIIFGAFASQNTTGNFNVFVGNQSGSTNTTGARNTLLGFNADVGAANLTNATAIGNLAQVNTSNSLVLGSINGVNGSLVSTNVGIGTTAPIRALHVSTGSSGGTPLGSSDIVLESNGPTYQHFLTPSTSETGILFGSNLNAIHSGIIANNVGSTLGLQFRAGGNTTRMTITSAGDVGIGTAAPGGQFELSLNEGRKPTSNTWTIPSDARLKEVHGTYQKGLSEIRQLRTVRYHYKNTDKKTFDPKVLSKEAFGFLAQEVQPLFPEAVGTDADGYLNFDLHPILIASINALQELDMQNQKLQQENELLKTQLAVQQEKLDYILSEIEKIKK
ncbi:tail fiber domain-containing protein [Flavobacterium sp. CYK-55]|uniref:tail fiber domain-containing protein n=1 Tax=Flavobacterium sp. CYK-55 TaxID=2835529 RepID=UPI001BCE4D94|nr:tail fiber domain-containing protein [Flavobacterium sp. CYK-55]MBS7787154.1 tail fiber domain-containing protein [Flavobacterium sp. CYK-55]